MQHPSLYTDPPAFSELRPELVFFFNQYLYNRDADQKITVGVAEGICGKEWPVVRQAIEEIAWHQPKDEFVIIKP